jgi:heavy metal translocating P-type ATPase
MSKNKTEKPNHYPAYWQRRLVVAILAAIACHFLLSTDLPLLIVIAVGGIPLVMRIAAHALKGDLGTDILGAIGLVTATILAHYLAASLILLMLAGGQALETYAMRRASAVLRALAARMPAILHRKVGEHVEDIALADVCIQDIILVYPHETCPTDGTVIEGHGAMDESYLTGEPYRVPKAPGAMVLSGAINGDAALTIRAEKLPQDSRYAKIMTVMEEAEQQRPHLRRLGDQLGGIFAVLALAVAGAVWLITGDVLRFLSVLVIATPCPLIIAIPVTIIGAISLAARRGIIIKDPTVLERLPTCRTAIFDKTGTLTYGRPELVDIIPARGHARDTVLQQAASLERYSKHPLATTILAAAAAARLVIPEAESVSEKPGEGLTGHVNGQGVAITHRKKLSDEIVAQLPPAQPGMECVVMVNHQLAATLFFRDTPRAEGKSFITHLAPIHHFAKVMLVSGDRASEVEYLAQQIGIKETYASQSPEQKLALVRAEAALAPTLFMGDGINDAPALAAATVGIAFGQQSIVAEAAGAVVMESTLAKVDELLHISTRLRHIALQSAVGGMVLSLMGMGFAAAGHITPVQGALLQEVIDVLAILNALRLTWQPKIAADIH